MRRIVMVVAVVLGLAVLGAPQALAAPGGSPAVSVSTVARVSASPGSSAAFNPNHEVAGVKPSVAQVYAAAAASGDGCTASPDSWGKANFRPACDKHDVCYSVGSTVDRKTCDTRFRSDLYRICDTTYASTSPFRYTCRGIAETYYAAVRTFGGSFYQGSGANN